MKKFIAATILTVAMTIPAYAASNDENVKIINTNHIDSLISQRNEAMEGNYDMKRKCQKMKEIQKLMENFIGPDLDQYNIDRIISSKRAVMGACIGH
jgi:uncharacterized ferredoxin-like protein